MNPRLLILLGAALFSTGGVAIKACTLTGWQVAAFRSGLAATALLVLLPAARRGWNGRVWLVGLAYAGTLVLYALSNKMTTAANAIFLQATSPLYVLVLSPLLLGESVRRHDIWFMVAAAFGIILFFVQVEAPLATAPRPVLGNVLAVLSGICYALTLLGIRWIARDTNPSDTTAMKAVITGNLLACLICLPWALPVVSGLSTNWLLIAYLGFFQIALAYLLVTAGMRRVTATEAALLILVEPVLNPIWVWWFQHERPGPLAMLGGAVILGACLLRIWQRWGVAP